MDAPSDASRAAPGSPRQPGFVFFCIKDWWYHSRAFSDFQIAMQTARTRQVLVVNSIGVRMPTLGRTQNITAKVIRKLKSTLKLLRRPVPELPHFWVMTPISIPAYGSRLARNLNAAFVRMQVQLCCFFLGIREPVIVITVPTALDVALPMKRSRLIYKRSDKHSEFREGRKDYLRRLEDELFRRSDRIVYVSTNMMEEEKDRTGSRSHFLDHGVDLEHFHPGVPAALEIAAIPPPRIGFFGVLRDELVDFDLLVKIAREIPEARLVLVGDATSPVDRLLACPNVVWLGPKPYAAVPGYGAGFNVGLLPYVENEWIRCCNPIKLKEYLGLGIPVVSTDFPAARRFERHVSIASGPEDFVARIRNCLAEKTTPEKKRERHEAVAAYSWAGRTAEFIDVCLAERE